MMTSLIWFFAGVALLFVVLAGACRIWGTAKFFLATLVCSCVTLATFLFPQVWSTELLWWVKVMAVFFIIVGIVAVALVTEAIVNEHCSSWKSAKSQRADRVIDITKPIQKGGER